MSCLFCKNEEVRLRAFAENDLAFASLSNIPIVPGHTIICPKRHVKYYEEMTFDERAAIEDLRTRIKVALKKSLGAEGFNCAWNEERVAGQSVEHFHLHLVPRKEGDAGICEYEPRKFLYRPGSRAAAPTEELESASEIIKKELLSF